MFVGTLARLIQGDDVVETTAPQVKDGERHTNSCSEAEITNQQPKKREEKPKVKKEFDPLDYHNMAWLKKKKADPYYGRDKNGKVYSLMDVLPDRSKVGNDEYFKTFREKVMNIINPIIDLGDIDLSKVPPKALAYMMDVLFRDKVWGVIGRKADEKIKATSFDDCILSLSYNNVNFSFDFKNGKYTLATTATD